MSQGSLFRSAAARQALTDLARPPAGPWTRREPVLAAITASTAPIVAVLVIELVLTQGSVLTIVLLTAALIVLNVAGVVARRAVSPIAPPALPAVGEGEEEHLQEQSHDHDG
jgi:hypothetical protein